MILQLGGLQRRFVTWYAILAVGAVALLGLATAAALLRQGDVIARSRALTEASLMAEAAAPLVRDGGAAARTELQALANRVAARTSMRVTIVDASGMVLADSESAVATMENHAGRPEIRDALISGQGQAVRHSATVDRDLLYAAVAIRSANSPGGATSSGAPGPPGLAIGVARLALDPASPLIEQLPVLVTVGATGAVIGLLAIVVAVLISRAIIRPLHQLTSAAQQLARAEMPSPLRLDGQDEVAVLAGAFDEMAERLRDEMTALRIERNRASAVLTNMADGIVIVDRSLLIQGINPAAARLLSLGETPVVARPLAEVVRDSEAQRALELALKDGTPHTAAVRLAANGDTRDVRATGIPLPAETHPSSPAGILVIQDMTEVRRADQVRREFIANVSHEFRTPLASLKALVETLEEGALDDPPAAREFLGQMHVEVDSLAQLVQELLELSRIESGQIVLRLEAVPPAGLVEEAERRLRMQAERASVAIDLQVAPDSPDVLADPARIAQVLINLLHNAIKFSPAGARVVVAVRPDQEAIVFSVHDSGIGIAADELPRLFERFYKVDRSRASRGTGLGLAIVKHIVQIHGGRVWAESAGADQGTTVSFALPAAPPILPPPTPSAA